MPLVLFKPIVMALPGTTIPSQSGPGSNGNEGVLRIPQGPQYHLNFTISLFSVISRTFLGGFLPLFRGAIGVFYSPHPSAD